MEDERGSERTGTGTGEDGREQLVDVIQIYGCHLYNQ